MFEYVKETLVSNPWACLEDKPDFSIPTATLEIYKFISTILDNGKGDVNRCSAANLCPRRRMYQGRGEIGEPLTPRKFINFLLGDLTERVVKYLIEQSLVGEGKLFTTVKFGRITGSFEFNGHTFKTYDQLDWGFKLGDMTITGHPDGIALNNKGEWELLEVKSFANYGFDGFKEEGAGDYRRQMHALMLCDQAKELGINKCRFFGLRKETGHLWDLVEAYDEAESGKVVDAFTRVNAAIKDKSIDIKAPFGYIDEMVGQGRGRPKVPSGRKTIGFPCTYCPFKRQCKGEYEVEFVEGYGGTKPQYIFKEAK